jgi:hypothetical protein
MLTLAYKQCSLDELKQVNHPSWLRYADLGRNRKLRTPMPGTGFESAFSVIELSCIALPLRPFAVMSEPGEGT